ncbi:MAG TPA: hypothetical protein VH116_07905 [Gemmatimonadales bacterium]|jgi:hypothetical protein|nr:hypothetical protein [Gemmatimonadales bacterium]
MSAARPAPADGTRVQTFILSGYTGAPRRGTVTIHVFTREQRWRRALAALGQWWGVALVSVFIPLAHFVLVPSFLLYGVWQFVQRLGTTQLATDARATCPDCHQEQALDLAPRWRAPQPVTCRYCHRGLRLSLPSTESEGSPR